MKHLYLYTATAGLGDYVVMGALLQAVERYGQGSRCLVVHRGNPHVRLWPAGDWRQRFFDIYSPVQVGKLFATLWRARRDGFTVFGLQMAPGSLQGFFLHLLLKKIGLVRYVVDANLINADIIIPLRQQYIYDLHVSQLETLRGKKFPPDAFRMQLPLAEVEEGSTDRSAPVIRVGIHPWSRRGHYPSFVWPDEKWLELIGTILPMPEVEIVLFGRDPRFQAFQETLLNRYGLRCDAFKFQPSQTVEDLVTTMRQLDMVVSVNTAVVHIGYALRKEMTILTGPSLDIWVPKGSGIRIFRDARAMFPGNDRWIHDPAFPSVERIDSGEVCVFLGQWLAAKRENIRRC